MVVPEPPMQDGPAYHLDFIDVISKEKYEGGEPFEIALIQSFVPGGPTITLSKEEDKYWLRLGLNIQLSPKDEAIRNQLEEIWQERERIHLDIKENTAGYPKWKSIKATVVHDPDNFGKAYLVSKIEFSE